MEKRERGSNFSESEKQLLLSIVSEHFQIIENKKSDALTIKEKNNAWELIAERFNAQQCENGTRTAVQLKNAYHNFKRKLKKDTANDKIDLYKTGGLPITSKIDDETSKLVALLKPQLEPVINKFDSSSDNTIKDDAKDENDQWDSPVKNIAAMSHSEDSSEIQPVSSGSGFHSGTKKLGFGNLKRKSITDINEKLNDEYTILKTKKTMLVDQKIEVEMEILKLKLQREKELGEINMLRIKQEQLKVDQEEEKLEQEKQKTKREVMKTKKMELGEFDEQIW
ncbi:hypothetical protein O3M35_008664 [Rhynocoris fuscipes]|uniref:Regulatory protein zeste n=1 Tax=Rhynocoris fuscipes TaxID=488301 RepID=A0AAW1D8K4_9HEMI